MIMLNIVMLILLINLIGNLIFKPKIDTLSCGNFGWIGAKPSNFNVDKFNILGIMNEKRGSDSCGVFINNELHKGDDIGTNNEALFRNLSRKVMFKKPKVSNVVMGHTRAASRVGIKSVENTHPFMFDMKNGYKFVGTHNGTLRNHVYLADKYGIKLTDDKNRVKIDSEILLEILSHISENEHNTKVLQEYTGKAALVMHSTEFPDEVWFYKGKSKEYDYAANVPLEERPLHIWNETEESMYWSSEYDALEVIANKSITCEGNNIKTLNCNVLYKIKGGKIVEKHNIDRSTNKKFDSKAEYDRHINSKTNSRVKQIAAPDFSNNNVLPMHLDKTKVIEFDFEKNMLTDIQKKMMKSIFYEKTLSFREFSNNNEILFQNFRYKTGNKLAKDGVYIYCEERGFIFVSDNSFDAESKLKDFKLTNIDYKKKVYYYNDISDLTLFYMFKGVLLKTIKDYNICKARNESVTLTELSHMSMYPVCKHFTPLELIQDKEDILTKKASHFIYKIIFEGAICISEVIQPLGSTSTYVIKNGNVIANKISTTYNEIISHIVFNSYDDIKREESYVEPKETGEKVVVIKNQIEDDYTGFEDGIDENIRNGIDNENSDDEYKENEEYIDGLQNVRDASSNFIEECMNLYHLDQKNDLTDLTVSIFEFANDFEKSFKNILNVVEETIFNFDLDSQQKLIEKNRKSNITDQDAYDDYIGRQFRTY